MPKVGEEFLYDEVEDKVIVKKTFDDTAELDRVKQIANAGGDKFASDYKFVGSVPMHLITDWIREAGVDMTDHHAVQEVMKEKLLSGEFDRLRVWKGKY